WWAAGASTALAAGPVIGGILIAALGWRAIFFINLPIGVVGMWLTARFSNETPAHKHQLDLPGQLAGIVALGALATATIEGGDVGWTRPVALGGSAVFALAARAFLLPAGRVGTPMLPLSLVTC